MTRNLNENLFAYRHNLALIWHNRSEFNFAERRPCLLLLCTAHLFESRDLIGAISLAAPERDFENLFIPSIFVH